MKAKLIASALLVEIALMANALQAQDTIAKKSRLTIGGYGEAV